MPDQRRQAAGQRQEARRPAVGDGTAARGRVRAAAAVRQLPRLKAAVTEQNDPIAETRRWLEHAVIGLNLCPFAKSVHAKGQVRYVLSAATTPEALLRSEEHTSELQSLMRISYAVFCLNKKTTAYNKRHQI